MDLKIYCVILAAILTSVCAAPYPQAQPIDASVHTTKNGIKIFSHWLENGKYRKVDAKVQLTVPNDSQFWQIDMHFSVKPMVFTAWEAVNGETCVGSFNCTLYNKFEAYLRKGANFNLLFQAQFDVIYIPPMSAEWGPKITDTTSTIPTTKQQQSTRSTTSTTTSSTPIKSSTFPTSASTTTAQSEYTTGLATMTSGSRTKVSATVNATVGAARTAPTSVPTHVTTGWTTIELPGVPKYSYGTILAKSILFFEAQRSGKLTKDKRISWRGDSALRDGSDVGLDLSGGWYEGAGYVKNNFLMASSVTLMSWGLLNNQKAFKYAGAWDDTLESIKWPLDYLLKCYKAPHTYYGQVGERKLDAAYWGRPEDMTMNRPTFALTPSKPGSDLTAETAAAMTAASLVFKDEDSSYASSLLDHAIRAYQFSKSYKGKYSESITNAADLYNSTGYDDELAWAALWLYKSTGKASYLHDARQYLAHLDKPTDMSWDNKTIGASLLLYSIDRNDTKAKLNIEYFVNYWLDSVRYTPKGLAWFRKSGSNMYAANAAFALQVAADLGFRSRECWKFAENQINYMLGDSGRSYVVGFGSDPPQQPYHRASSCPKKPNTCDWNNFVIPSPNPQVLDGALVGGPGAEDDYEDKRADDVRNRVACHYNTGFQSAVAGLLTKFMPS